MRIEQTRTLFGGSKLMAGAAIMTAAAGIAIGLIANTFAAGAITVSPADAQGWYSADTRGSGGINFIEDASSPYPDGALRLTTGDDNADKAQYLKDVSLPLSGLDELSYHTKQNAGPAHAAASYQIEVDLNGAEDGGFTTLVYEPYWNGTVEPNVWQEWDVDSGQFWSSRSVAPHVTAGAGGPPFYTLDQLNEWYPDAVVQAFGVNVGTYNLNYDVEVDGVSFNGTTYNFEAETPDTTAPTVAINSPLAGATVQGNVALDATIADDNALLRYYYFVKSSDGDYVVGPETVTTSDAMVDFQKTVDTAAWADGEYVFQMEARDAAGNKGAESTAWVSFTVNNVVDTKDDCKQGGWKTFLRADGSSFKNQGQCVAYVASSDNSKHHRN